MRLVCRELSRVVRDLLVLAVDPSRADDPEIAGENERSRLIALAGQFSREDLLRAFDLLTRAEAVTAEGAHEAVAARVAEARTAFVEAMQSDLNTAGALGAIFEHAVELMRL